MLGEKSRVRDKGIVDINAPTKPKYNTKLSTDLHGLWILSERHFSSNG